MEEDLIGKKAELILGGSVVIPKGYRIPVRISRSTAGPGAGNRSLVFAFGGLRVKKSISYDEGDFELVTTDGHLGMTRHGEPFLNDVAIEPVAFHCPEQAFFNLDQRCMFHCVYCSSPLLDKDSTKGLTDDKIVEMIHGSDQKIYALALTSGVVGSIDDTVDRFVKCVGRLRKEFPDLPIGVEPYVDKTSHIDRLKEAGADEIKINCEAATREIFRKACPDLDYSNIFDMLEYSVKVFGKGHVASNVIIGLGETDEELTAIMTKLCSMGVEPVMRCLRTSAVTADNLSRTVGRNPVNEERLIGIAKEQKAIMSSYGLDTGSFRTMCFKCGCCDLVPFRDV